MRSNADSLTLLAAAWQSSLLDEIVVESQLSHAQSKSSFNCCALARRFGSARLDLVGLFIFFLFFPGPFSIFIENHDVQKVRYEIRNRV